MVTGKVICMDMDGILSNFYPGYNAICERLGKPILPVGRWDDFLDKEVWAEIKSDSGFWSRLPSLVSGKVFDRIQRLKLDNTVYFVTNRVGIRPHVQTRMWLERHGVYRPTVIVSKLKGEVAKALSATHFIEDKAENAWCVAWLSPGTQSYLLDAPYNQYDPGQFGSRRVKRIGSVEEFLDIVEGGN